MGKKSKRSRGNNNNNSNNNNGMTKVTSPPSLRNNKEKIDDEETKDNLKFEDPYPDEYEIEQIDKENMDSDNDDESDDDDDDDGENLKMKAVENKEDNDDMIEDDVEEQTSTAAQTQTSNIQTKSWNPLTGQPLENDEELQMDETAYKMYHSLNVEWPCLSFDFIKDNMGDVRTKFPHSLIVAAGSQADVREKNTLTIMKLSDLQKIKHETIDDILGEEYNPNKRGDDSDSDSDDDEDDEIDLDPILEHYTYKHYGGVNRLRVCPQISNIVATWSDTGNVNLYDISNALGTFGASSNNNNNKNSTNNRTNNSKDPFFVYSGHNGIEGYAMDWSKYKTGNLATGDCNGNIHLWQLRSEGGGVTSSGNWNTSSFIKGGNNADYGNVDNPSIEDIQWSPTESTVFATGECGGYIRIYDTRASTGRAMLSYKINSNNSDVNVISWNPLVSNLIATGSDDGTLCVYDMQMFKNPNENPQPLARFTSHKTPITSLEWHPTDNSMLAVSDDVGTYVYDISVEEDDDDGHMNNNAGENNNEDEIPPQLLFVHCGSEQFKEIHWHPQIPSCLMTTALTGFNTFIPSNL